jgi:hypothetical protein
MNALSSIDPMAFFAAGIAAALVVLLVLELLNNRRVTKLTYPVYEYALKRAEDEAERIVQTAREESRRIMEQAEKDSLALVSSRTADTETAQRAYADALQALLARLQSQFQSQAQSAAQMEHRIGDEIASSLKIEGDTALAHEREIMNKLDDDIQKHIDEHMNMAFEAIDKQVGAYERSRRDIVDARIAELVGETIKIVLQKNLPEGIHADMVYAALEEAKAVRAL